MKRWGKLLMFLVLYSACLAVFPLPPRYNHRVWLGYHPPYCGALSDDGCINVDVP